MTGPTCDACTAPVPDQARLCGRCSHILACDLGDVGALDAELNTTRLKQDRMAGAATGVLSRSAEVSLPWNQHAAEVQDALRATVLGWVRVVLKERGGPMPTDTMPVMGRWLLASVPWLRHHPDAAEMADEMHDAAERARQAVDRRADATYWGPCGSVEYTDDEPSLDSDPCPAELYGSDTAMTVVCRECRASHRVADIRVGVVAMATDQLVTAAVLSKLFTAYGAPLTLSRVTTWVARGRLTPRGQDPLGRALYRIGEAQSLVEGLTGRGTKMEAAS